MGKKVLKIITALVVLGAAVFAVLETLKIREISVTGCSTKDPQKIAAESGLTLGTSIFLIDKKKVHENLEQDPFVKPLSVQVELPDKVVINIDERKRAAYIEKEGAFLVIDKEGWLLEVIAAPETIDYPVILGMTPDAANVGKRLSTSDSFKLDVLSRVIGSVEENGLDAVSIDVSLAASIAVGLRSGMRIELGDDTRLEQKMQWIKASLAALKQNEIEEGILDVSTVKYAYHRVK